MPLEFTDSECLEMSIFAINYTVQQEELCPILLVFVIIPRPAQQTPQRLKFNAEMMIERTINEVSEIHSKVRVAFGLKHFGRPKRIEQSKYLRNLPAGSPVLVYRTTSKC